MVGTQASQLAGYSYTLGAAGNRTAVTELGGRTVNYTYDDLYRLTSESIADDSHGVNGSASYSYDPVGNRLNRSSSVATVPSQSSTALGAAVRTIGGLIREGGEAAAPLRFSQISPGPFFGAQDGNLFRNLSIAQVVKSLRSGEISFAQIPVRYVLRRGVRLIVNTRSSLQTLENGDDIALRLARNGLDENGTDVIRVGELYRDPNLPDLSIWDDGP